MASLEARDPEQGLALPRVVAFTDDVEIVSLAEGEYSSSTRRRVQAQDIVGCRGSG